MRPSPALPSPAAQATPIVAMTANVLPEQVEKCLAAGMDDHLGKPISPRALLGALKAANPKLNEILQLRQLILNTLYTRREIERMKSQFPSISAILRPKIGRNDPCPCGSGLKYKRCCL